MAYKTAGAKLDNKVYDPFEILGLSAVSDVLVSSIPLASSHRLVNRVLQRRISNPILKSFQNYSASLFSFSVASVLNPPSHPDKVKISGNDTIESIANKFVEITKAYKSYVLVPHFGSIVFIILRRLTDETIRRNWELYGHPDGRQEVSMGIALPQWIIEGKNNIWVLGVYGVIFGGVLPVLVGRWWFGSRQKTKDGVNALSAASFFKSLSEDSGIDDVVGTLGKSYAWESKPPSKSADMELEQLERSVSVKMGADWEKVLKLAGVTKTRLDDEASVRRQGALVLLYAHFLRIEIGIPSLQNGAFVILFSLVDAQHFYRTSTDTPANTYYT